MKVIVFGATGLAGQAIVASAFSRNYTVRTAARNGCLLSIDMCNENDLVDLLELESPDVIINCAGLTDIELCETNPLLGWQVNARAVAILAGWASKRKSSLIQISTDHFYTAYGAEKHKEDSFITLVNEYARQKYAAEQFALLNSKALVIRTSIVGLRGWIKPTFAEWALDTVCNDKEAILFTDAYTSSIDVWTFAECLFDLIEKKITGLLNLASSEVYTKKDFVLELAEQMNKPLTKIKLGGVGVMNVRRAHCLGLNVDRAERLLGYDLPKMKQVVNAVIKKTKEVK